MFSLVKAINPPTTKTSRHIMTIGRRVSPNCSRPFNTTRLSIRYKAPARPSLRRRGERVAQKQRAFGGDQFADSHAFENLTIAAEDPADLDSPLAEPPAVGGHPNGHGAVAFAHHAV